MANGKFAGGDGSKENPFLIEDALDLDSVRNGLDKCYKLIKNIDLNIKPFNEGDGWKSIGYGISNGFQGEIFDGNGHLIKNMYINNSANMTGGLFSEVNNTTIKNLGVIDAKISGFIYEGALFAGDIENTTIINCFGIGSINSTAQDIGGLVGCISENCTIKNCYTICDITGTDRVGGFIGYRYRNSFTISNCYCVGKVIGTKNIISNNGGFAGRYVSDCRTPNVTNIYFNKTICDYDDAIAEGKTTEQMKNSSTFKEWANEKTDDGKPVWKFEEGQYPRLWFEKDPSKYLIKQNNNYYSLKSSFFELGQPKDANEKEQFYKDNGIDNLNTLVEKKNNKSFDLKLDKNDIYKTITNVDLNEITDKIEYIDEDNKKEIKYNTEEYQLLDLIKKKIGSKFQIAKWEEK